MRVRPGKNDHKHWVRIRGAELWELKLIDLPESFGLDRRVERYEGKASHGFIPLGSGWFISGIVAGFGGSLPAYVGERPVGAEGAV